MIRQAVKSSAERIVDYCNLEQAYLEVVGYADEEKIINLQNHLIWQTYNPDNSITDLVVERAIIRVVIPDSKPRHISLTVAGGKEENTLVPYCMRYPDGEQRRA